jgi:hypothetical protein
MCGCNSTANFDNEIYPVHAVKVMPKGNYKAYADPSAAAAGGVDPISAIANAAGSMFSAYGKIADIFGKKEERKTQEEITKQVDRTAQAQEYLATIGLQGEYAKGQNQFSDNILKLKQAETQRTPTAVYVVGIMAVVLIVLSIVFFRK